jgi:3-oxoacyl-[acyl-carrier-protein] synthase-3
VLHILGIGAAYPDTVISNDLLIQFGGFDRAALERAGIGERRSVLPLDYLRETKNVDPKAGEKAMVRSPSDLALAATEVALARAGVPAGDIGLIVGEACSPVETTPSEAQRLGARLGIKANAYDVLTGANGLLLQLSMFDATRTEKLPDIIVCVSANTPTQQVDYRGGDGAIYLGDAAVAVVVSPNRVGRLKLGSIGYTADSTTDFLAFETYGHARCEAGLLGRYVAERGSAELGRVWATKPAGRGTLKVVPPQFDAPSNAAVFGAISPNGTGGGVATEWSNVSTRGYTAGAAALSVLADRWDHLVSGDMVALIGVGGGSNFGHGLFSVV